LNDLVKITDKTGRRWTVARRWSPWRRVVQPINIPFRGYLRYGVTVPVPRGPSRWERRGRKTVSSESFLGAVAEFAGEIARGLAGLVWLVAVVVGWLVLLPCAVVEFCAQVVAGVVLWLLRLTRCVRSRVDVVSHYPRGGAISSLTVLTVSGFGEAGRLARAVAEEREAARTPFDPHRPEFAALREKFGARVERHESGPVVAVPERGALRYVRPRAE
jgi:hypothetical protein